MERADQRKITSNLTAVKDTIKKDIDRIVERLTEDRIISKHAKDEIARSETDMKCGVFINRLLRSGTRAYQCFQDILEELGYHKLVMSMEKSKTICYGAGWTEDREKTFIVPPPKIPSLMSTTIVEEDETGPTDTEVVQLEKMVTFVLNTMNDKNSGATTNTTKDFKKEFRKKLLDESRENGELVNFFKTIRCTSMN